mmetsp:Transcript_16892/g.29527  ORF Transcript_16892/g.29527 Transcript_16892/m.29527 type:complete len:206 (+) Transcript_16892:1229-1846(+)
MRVILSIKLGHLGYNPVLSTRVSLANHIRSVAGRPRGCFSRSLSRFNGLSISLERVSIKHHVSCEKRLEDLAGFCVRGNLELLVCDVHCALGFRLDYRLAMHTHGRNDAYVFATIHTLESKARVRTEPRTWGISRINARITTESRRSYGEIPSVSILFGRVHVAFAAALAQIEFIPPSDLVNCARRRHQARRLRRVRTSTLRHLV